MKPLSRGRRIALWIVGAVAVVAAIVVYGLVDPATHFFPRCSFKVITGYNCPGCGSQRAIHSLLHGDLVKAFYYNALMVLAIPYVLLIVSGRLMIKKYPGFYMRVTSPTACYIVLAVVIIWWIGRNIFLPIDF